MPEAPRDLRARDHRVPRRARRAARLIELGFIARQGCGLLSTYERADEAAREMDRLAALRAELVDPGYTAGGDHVTEALTWCCRFEDRAELDNLKSLGKPEPWGRWLAIARAHGCGLAWQSFEDQRATYARLAQPAGAPV